jgi:hypothetical protein
MTGLAGKDCVATAFAAMFPAAWDARGFGRKAKLRRS